MMQKKFHRVETSTISHRWFIRTLRCVHEHENRLGLSGERVAARLREAKNLSFVGIVRSAGCSRDRETRRSVHASRARKGMKGGV